MFEPFADEPPQTKLTATIAEALRVPDRLLGMIKDADKVARELSWEAIAEKTFGVYQDVLGEPRHALWV